MDLALYLGLSQSLFAVIVILLKKPQKIADIILSILLFVFTIMFGLDVLHDYGILPANRWVISISLTLLFAPLLYLYSKYITKDFPSFDRFDYLHALPSVLILFVYFVFYAFASEKSIWEFMQNKWFRQIFGNLFVVQLFLYVFLSLKIVIRFKKLSNNYYSYKSDTISLNWLIFVIASFFLIFLLIIISSLLFEYRLLDSNVDKFRHLVELSYVYVISIWGFRQSQLHHEFGNEEIDNPGYEITEPASLKYQKSGLKEAQVEVYLQKIIKYIEQTESWKDNELSVAKLSTQTKIPKYYISEVLNEHLGKNFYQFINEYRLEHAKKLLKSDKHSSWSIIAIAYECGFNSKTAFNNFFKKHSNMTPSQFKNLS